MNTIASNGGYSMNTIASNGGYSMNTLPNVDVAKANLTSQGGWMDSSGQPFNKEGVKVGFMHKRKRMEKKMENIVKNHRTRKNITG